MKYALSNPLQAKQAEQRLQHLTGKGATVELTEKRGNRTLSQNAYLHLILTAWGGHLGYTLEEMKQIVKEAKPALFAYEKRGYQFTRSTAELDTKEMTEVIDWVRYTAQERHGYYIPAPNEKELLIALENEADRYSAYN